MHSDLFVPGGHWIAALRRVLFILVTPFVVASAARAGVYLTSYNFATDNLPQVYTDESLPSPYRLRAKFAGNYQEANGWNNNWQTLEGTPGTGSTTVQLYWVKYASDQTTVLEIGPMYQYNVFIGSPNNASSQNVTTYGNQPFTPAYNNNGGTSTGAWQFVISAYTNWGGTQAGTLLPPSNTPATSWVPPGAGSYTFYVQKKGDTTHLDSAPAGPYTLTVQAQTWDWGATPSSAPSGSPYTVYANVVNAGGLPNVTLYKNGAYFSSATFGTQGTTTDTGAQTVNYTASFGNYTGNSGSSSKQVSIYTYTLGTSVSPAGAGSITLSPSGGSYSPGATVSATATANSGYSFTGWSGSASGTTNPVSVTMDSNKSITANFAANTAPSVTTQPSSQSVNLGSNATFSITAGGTAPLTYQWRKNGSNISGATAATLNLASVQPADAATYSCVVTNSYGSATSNGATLTVNTAPTISSQPQNQTVASGDTASFSVAATGAPAPTYQWRKNGTAISGATGSTLTLSNVQAADAANYSVVATNSAGSATSNTATLTVTQSYADDNSRNQVNVHTPN